MTTTHRERSAIGAMYAGLGLTVVALIVVYVGHATANVLADHIRAGYPTYSQARVDSTVTTYLVYLSVVGALGIVCWLSAIWAVKAGKRWARGAATATFRARHGHRPVRSARQGQLGRHRPAAVAGLGRDAAVPGRALRGDPAVEEIVTSTSSHVGRLAGCYAAIPLAGECRHGLGAKFTLTQPASSEGGALHEGEP